MTKNSIVRYRYFLCSCTAIWTGWFHLEIVAQACLSPHRRFTLLYSIFHIWVFALLLFTFFLAIWSSDIPETLQDVKKEQHGFHIYVYMHGYRCDCFSYIRKLRFSFSPTHLNILVIRNLPLFLTTTRHFNIDRYSVLFSSFFSFCISILRKNVKKIPTEKSYMHHMNIFACGGGRKTNIFNLK